MKTNREHLSCLKALAHSHRLQILLFLKKGESCVCEIGKALKLPQNLTSHHLSVLKEEGFVLYRREGKKRLYCLSDGHIFRRLNEIAVTYDQDDRK